jgi:hypothetical protein
MSEEKQDWYATCNGCGAHLSEEEVAYTNDDIGDDYCADCYEGIQGDDESSGRVKDSTIEVEHTVNRLKDYINNKIYPDQK